MQLVALSALYPHRGRSGFSARLMFTEPLKFPLCSSSVRSQPGANIPDACLLNVTTCFPLNLSVEVVLLVVFNQDDRGNTGSEAAFGMVDLH